jgi:hypothetical protein
VGLGRWKCQRHPCLEPVPVFRLNRPSLDPRSDEWDRMFEHSPSSAVVL